MGLSNYSINPMLGNYDLYGLMNNQYFQYAWNTPNVNFKGKSSGTESGSNASGSSGSGKNVDGGIPTKPQTSSDSGSALGAISTVGGILALGGGALYLLKTGKLGKAKDVIKSALGGNKTVAKLKSLTAVKTPDNKIKFLIPEKTKTVTGETAINNLAREYGIETSIQGERIAFSPAHSVIDGFRCTVNGESFVVHTKDGVITKIVDKDGKEVLKKFTDAQTDSADAATFEKMKNALKELAKEKDADKNMFGTIDNIQYTNVFGDDILKLSMEHYGAEPRINQFTTLERFDFSSSEMQSFALNSNEKVFVNKKFYEKGKLVDGLTVSEFSDQIGNSNFIGNFEGRTLVSIKKPDGTILPVGSAGYEDIKTQYQKEIDKLLRSVFDKRDYIPTGAKIVTM